MRIKIKKPNLANYQKQIIYCEKRFTVTEASTKTGKTFSHLFWLFEMAHGNNKQYYSNDIKEGMEFWWVAPIYTQAKIAFNRMKLRLKGATSYKINESDLYIETPLGSIIRFKSADKPDGLYGEDVYAVVFDEFTRAKETAWHAIRSTITATKAPCKFIGNYKGKSNWGHKLGKKALTDDNYAYFKITAYDAVEAGILDLQEVEDAKSDLPKAVFDALYLAEGDIDDGLLFMDDDIQNAFTNNFIKPNEKNKFLTCDIAAYGSDRFVCTYWEGWVIQKIYVFSKLEPDQVEQKIRELAKHHGVARSNIIYDADGLGTYLRGYLKGAKHFINGAKPIKVEGKDENYKHLKAQCWYMLSHIFSSNEIFINDETYKEDIVSELGVIKRLISEGKLTIIPKKKITQILGYSPDIADTLMMRVYGDISKKKSKYGIANIKRNQ